MNLNLFNQNPNKVVQPSASDRSVQALRFERKGDLDRFRRWMEGASRENLNFPSPGEISKLNKEASSARRSTFAIIGSLVAVPLAGFAVKSLMNLDLSSILSGDISSLENMFGSISTNLGLDKLFKGFGSNKDDETAEPLPDAPEVSDVKSPPSNESGSNQSSQSTTSTSGSTKTTSDSPNVNVEPPAVTPKLEVENPFKELFDFITGVFKPKSSGTSGTQPAQPTTGASKLIDLVPYEDFSRLSSEGGRGMVGKSHGGAYDPSGTINSRGYPHYGVDIGTSGQTGYYVALKANGKVSLNQFHSGGGNMLFIKVGGTEYVFMHLARPSVLKVGENYSAGTPIGEIGKTGNSPDIHLHFEVRPAGGDNKSAIDPNPYLNMIEIGKLNPNQTASADTGVSGESTVPDVAQQDQPNPTVASLSSLFGELAPVLRPIMEEVQAIMQIPRYMQEYSQESRVAYNSGDSDMTNTSLRIDPSIQSGESTGGSEAVEPAPAKEQTVTMFTPEAEAMLNNTIVMNQQIIQNSGSDGGVEQPMVGSGSGGRSSNGKNSIIVSSMSPRSIHNLYMYAKLENS